MSSTKVHLLINQSIYFLLAAMGCDGNIEVNLGPVVTVTISKEVSNAMSDGSNKALMRSFIEWLTDILAKNGIDKDHVVFLGE